MENNFEFKPSKEVRSVDLNYMIGKEVMFRLQHKNDGGTKQYISLLHEHDLVVSEEGGRVGFAGWAPIVLGEPNTDREAEITDAYFMVHQNGGRTMRPDRPRTYDQFYDNWQKQMYNMKNSNGLIGVITGPHGDFHYADIALELKFGGAGFVMTSMCFDIPCPEEWYSEVNQEAIPQYHESIVFENGNEAVEHFSKQATDDMFGERYFPVMVFPVSADFEKIRNDVTWLPKACSSPILKGDHVYFGTRCKRDEYDELIHLCYAHGGQILKTKQWDWGG